MPASKPDERDSSASPLPTEATTSPGDEGGREKVGTGHGSGSRATRFGGERAPVRKPLSTEAGRTAQTNSDPEADRRADDEILAQQLKIAQGKVKDAPASAQTAAARAYHDLRDARDARRRAEEDAGRVDWGAIGSERRDAILVVLDGPTSFSLHVLEEGNRLGIRTEEEEQAAPPTPLNRDSGSR